MFKKIFRNVKNWLAPKVEKASAPKTVWKEIPKPVEVVHRTCRGRRTWSNNQPGAKRKPPTMMPSPDNVYVQMSDGTLDHRWRNMRLVKHRNNGRHYHRPWPFKKELKPCR